MTITIGDYVKFPWGKVVYKVKRVRGFHLDVVNTKNGLTLTNYSIEYFVKLDPEITKEQEKKVMENTLYQIKETEFFCHQIGTNQQGKFVVELKGTGEIKVVDKDQLIEVVPYTVCLMDKFTSKKEFFIVEPEKLKKGEILMGGSTFYVVTDVDTKVKIAKDLPKNLLRLVTEAI